VLICRQLVHDIEIPTGNGSALEGQAAGPDVDPPRPRPPLGAGRESLTDGAPQRYECRAADCGIVHAASVVQPAAGVTTVFRVRLSRNALRAKEHGPRLKIGRFGGGV
jgi:hypothetical protein